jgi:hypothetical protein
MTVIKIRERSRTLFRLEGKVDDELIYDAFAEAKRRCGNKKGADIFMTHQYIESEDDTVVRIYPCKFGFEKAFSANLHTKDVDRRVVDACNVCYDSAMLSISDSDIIELLWMPVKKKYGKFLTMIPYTSKAAGTRKRLHFICDSRAESGRSEELLFRAALHMMDAIALNADGIDLTRQDVKAPPALLYLERVSEAFNNLLLELNMAD